MQTIGQTLQQAREQKGISLKQAAHDTKIKLGYLEALEANEFSHLIAPVYAKSFLRMYAVYLGLDGNALVEQFQAEQSAAKPLPAQPPPQTASIIRKSTAPSKPDTVKPRPPTLKARNSTRLSKTPALFFAVIVGVAVGLAILSIAYFALDRQPARSSQPRRSTAGAPTPSLVLHADELLKVNPAQAADRLELPRPRRGTNP